MRIALVHYHEIALKGRNRGAFERRLQANIAWALREVPDVEVLRTASRVLVRIHDEVRLGSVVDAITRTPGVAYVVTGIETHATPEALTATSLAVAAEEIAARGEAIHTFAIQAHRSATEYPERSIEINRRVGEDVRQATGLRVNLDEPDLAIRIIVVQGRAFVCAHRAQGPGGLPVGSSGKTVALLSAGIDSPVAAWRIMKRGAMIIGVHFSGRPQTPAHSEYCAADIARTLGAYGGMARLYIVAFGDIQREIALRTPDSLRILLYRREMIRVAEALAAREGALALVTGESLGQVASQTLENLAAIDAAAQLPILRPLVGSDKQEIIAEARRIGTYDLSIASHDDCCTLFMPQKPETHVRPGQLEEAEASLDVSELTRQALAAVSVRDFESVSQTVKRECR